MKRTFKYELVFKDTEKDWGLGQGVLLSREKVWDSKTCDRKLEGPCFEAAVHIDARGAFLDQHVDVRITEVKPKPRKKEKSK